MGMEKYNIYNGKSLSEWSRITGIKAGTLSYRIRKGWTLEKALNTPIMTHSEAAKKYDVLGKIFEDRFGNEFLVKEISFRDKYDVAHYKCVFLKSGYETDALVSQIVGSSGEHVFDRYSPSVHNVGIMGNAYMKDNPKLFDVWRAMIARCYNQKNPSYKTYGAKGITVCERWKRFDYFLEDVTTIKGFDQELINKGKLVLDKDIINRDAKIYSPETCCFVSRSENTKESSTRTWKERKSVTTIP